MVNLAPTTTMTAGPSNYHSATNGTRQSPILVSIGSFLIDAFDTPPRPIMDGTPLPPHPSFRASAPKSQPLAPLTPPSPSNDPLTPINGDALSHTSSEPICSRYLNTPITTPTGSGSNTPQLRFNDMPPPERPFECLGGGALYALIGARLFLSSENLKTLVDRAIGGTDLPDTLVEQASQFGDMWIWNEGPGTKMARARIRYEGDDRLFHATVRPPYRSFKDLLSTPLHGGEYLHVAPPFSAEDVATLQTEIRKANSESSQKAWTPKIIFEPTPPSCHPGQRSWLEKVAPGLHVLSPNHEELLSFYGHTKIPLSDLRFVPTLEGVMSHLLNNVGIGEDGSGILAVRCGRLGGCVGTKKGGLRWFPAYWSGENEHRVRDVTGAGNSFIGGYVAGLSLTNEDPFQAALYGTVAASFVVEQIGLPSISRSSTDGGSVETWNDDSPLARVEHLRQSWAKAGIL